ncbi:TRAF3-interacting protein 1-like [Scleropages formosus]|uniref:TRAF3-interacting protein 1-like n=1 Tax=Scleropages formosus TaxID=113540 RepID=A0A0P7VDV2_SCLFO|nr:TRAF3-interacting protein 1-like [Scleropages formosus]
MLRRRVGTADRPRLVRGGGAMDASVLKKTQDTLGKVIKKPPLTEKLLSKPPFRYLHDIITVRLSGTQPRSPSGRFALAAQLTALVIRTTGFMKGLYGEAELNSENVKDKDTKIAFLQKAIDVVAMVSGEALVVRPVRVVAGHEAERTNEFLQAVGRCCLNKLSSEDAVKRVLGGDKPDPRGKFTSSRSKDKENHEARERHREKEPRRDIKEQSSSRDRKESDVAKELESRRSEKDKPREAERTKDSEGKRPENEKPRETERRKESEGRRLEKERPRVPERMKERERSKDKSRDRERDKAKDRGRERDAHREKDRERDREKRKERDRDRERRKDTEDRQKESERAERKDRDLAEEPNKQPAEQPLRNGTQDSEEKLTQAQHSVSPSFPARSSVFEVRFASGPFALHEPGLTPLPCVLLFAQQESPARIPRPSSAKGQRQWPKAGAPGDLSIPGLSCMMFSWVLSAGAEPHLDKNNPLENGDMVDSQRPQTAVSPNRRIPRPSSARPAPPRVRRQESNAEGVSAERLGSTKPPSAVIIDGRKLSQDEEDDEQFVVEEAAPLPSDMPELEAEPDAEIQGNDKHGGLVKKILETKRDYETSSSSPKSKEQNFTNSCKGGFPSHSWWSCSSCAVSRVA